MEHNYVKCDRCDQWDLEERHKTLCKDCNNTQKIVDPKEILCNLCAVYVRPLGTMNENCGHGLEDISIAGGHNSYHLFDGTTYTFDLCEKCLRELFINCKIKPKVFDRMVYEQVGWEGDQEHYEYRIWKDTGGHHQAYLDRKCNAVKDCPNRAEYTVLKAFL
jgi:hypothetical protein